MDMGKSDTLLRIALVTVCFLLMTALFIFRIFCTAPIEMERPGEIISTDSDSATQSGTPSGLININTADATSLSQLPGIGIVIAQRIVDYRQQNGLFYTVHDLMNVAGIGEATFQKIIPYITTGGNYENSDCR